MFTTAGSTGSLGSPRPAPHYKFVYHDGSPACFADVEVWARIFASGPKILVFGQAPLVQTDGDGVLPVTALPAPGQFNWQSPEVRLIDQVAGRTVAGPYPLPTGNYLLDWNRPAPFAEFDGLQFASVSEYLDYLVTRYGFLTSITPTPLTFSLNRVGSPAPAPDAVGIFDQIKDALHRADGNFLLDPNAPDINQEMDDEHFLPGRRVLWALSSLIPVGARTSGRHTRDTMAAAYREMLQRVAAHWFSLPLAKILKALSDALPGGPAGNQGVINQLEDWALAGLLIFLAGLNAYGYVFAGDVDEPFDQFMTIFGVTMVLPKH